MSCKIINICPSSSLIRKEILHCATSSRWSSLIYDLQSWYAILMFCGKKQCIYGRFGLFPEWLQARVQVEVTGRAGTKAKIAHFFKKRRVVFGFYSKQTNHYIPTQPAESILYIPTDSLKRFIMANIRYQWDSGPLPSLASRITPKWIDGTCWWSKRTRTQIEWMGLGDGG